MQCNASNILLYLESSVHSHNLLVEISLTGVGTPYEDLTQAVSDKKENKNKYKNK